MHKVYTFFFVEEADGGANGYISNSEDKKLIVG